MKVALVIIAICVALSVMVYWPVIFIGGIISVLCFVFEHPVAGVIVGIVTIIAQVAVGREFGIYGDAGSDTFVDPEDYDRIDDGLGFPEMYISYKIGESQGRKHKDK